MRKAGEMADKQRERRAKTNIDAFLQHTSIGQRRDYLARERRFGTLDGGQLRESWIIAVRNWLARKDRAAELTMDDLTAELRLRGLEPPYDARSWPLASPDQRGRAKQNLKRIRATNRHAQAGERQAAPLDRPSSISCRVRVRPLISLLACGPH